MGLYCVGPSLGGGGEEGIPMFTWGLGGGIRRSKGVGLACALFPYSPHLTGFPLVPIFLNVGDFDGGWKRGTGRSAHFHLLGGGG